MTDTHIRNRIGKTIAIIKTSANGDQTIHDPWGKRLGVYSARDNKTRDPYGRTIGFGNLLTSLIDDWD